MQNISVEKGDVIVESRTFFIPHGYVGNATARI